MVANHVTIWPYGLFIPKIVCRIIFVFVMTMKEFVSSCDKFAF